jgi:transcriptional regulator with XRE-family HTH domain
MSGLAGVSIPYLSQVERGLRRPSADILQGIARGLQVSAETLYVQAGILEERPAVDVVAAIRSDPNLNERQRGVLVSIYHEFRRESEGGGSDGDVEASAPARADRSASSDLKQRTTTKAARAGGSRARKEA